jgi:light-regulated signal transduction histidine kinase (bacteriophytochrome)
VRADQEIMALNAELERRVEQRTAELSAANRELEAFSYSIAHDLKAPLRAIAGFADGLREGFASEDAGRRGVDRIIANAARMTEMIDDLLRLSQVTLSPLARRPLDLALVARAVAREALSGYPRAQLQVADIPTAQADPGLLQQVYSNLIINALKFSSKQAHPRVEVGAESRNGDMIYFVRDNGAGFDMSDAHRLFGVFQRLHSPREFEGTGIGLAIVRRIVQRHGGRIWANATRGAGATFHFTLDPTASSTGPST